MTAKDQDPKKIQAVLHDLSKRLQDGVQNRYHVTELFTPELNLYRMRLRDYCNRFYDSDPIKNGEKAMDLYWRKGLYETLMEARNVKQGWTPLERAYVQSHLLSGLGYFTETLLNIFDEIREEKNMCKKFEKIVQLDFLPIPQKYGYTHCCGHTKGQKKGSKYDKDILFDWVKVTVRKCLMYLGDITRYISELDEGKTVLARRFYNQAILWDPSTGLPFNQLASLVADDNHGLPATIYYLKSLLCENPFEGGKANLKKVFEKNEKMFSRYRDSNKDTQDLDVLSPTSEKQRCVVFLLEMVNVFLFNQEVNPMELSELCQMALQTVQHCLYLHVDDIEEENKFQILLPSSVATNMVILLILVIRKLKNKETLLSMLRAYLLALFSHFVTKFLADLHCGLYGSESLAKLFEPTEEEKKLVASDDEEEEKETQQEEEEKEKETQSKVEDSRKKIKGLERFKRRRKIIDDSEDSELESDDEGGDDQSETETDESSISSKKDEEIGEFRDSEMSDEFGDENDSEEDEDGIYHSDSNSDLEDEFGFDDDDVVIESSKPILANLKVVKMVNEHNLYEAIRIGCLWLMGSKKLMKEAGSTSEVLWIRFSKLFRILNLGNEEYEKSEIVSEAIEKFSSESHFLEDFHTTLLLGRREQNENQRDEESLTEVEKGVVKILQLEKFRDWLCQSSDIKFKFPNKISPNVERIFEDIVNLELEPESKLANESVDLKNGPKPIKGQKTTNESEKVDNKPEDEKETELKQLKMMENMAHLWLQHEVHDLEGKGSRHHGTLMGFAHYTPYIVVDHLALYKHLKLVMEIVDSKTFAVIVPTDVIQHLDDMKKKEGNARLAIRWLEREFEKGNRWLRSQKKGESRGIDANLSLNCKQKKRERDRDAHRYVRILECCHHFALVRGEDVASEKVQVTLLTADEDRKEEKEKSFNAEAMAAMFNVKVEKIDKFVRQTSNPGNRRDRKRNRNRQRNRNRKPDENKKLDVENG